MRMGSLLSSAARAVSQRWAANKFRLPRSKRRWRRSPGAVRTARQGPWSPLYRTRPQASAWLSSTPRSISPLTNWQESWPMPDCRVCTFQPLSIFTRSTLCRSSESEKSTSRRSTASPSRPPRAAKPIARPRGRPRRQSEIVCDTLSMATTEVIFPERWVWGAATAAYQIEGAVREGGRGPSIWDTFSHTQGKTVNGDTGEVACDHFHRYPDDVAIMAGLGMNAYRFSIAWPRIFPSGSGDLNQAGMDFYRRLAEACLERGIAPYATLYHWDLPQPLEDAGGWLNRDTAVRFRDYAAATQQALGDVISHWITLNEPWCSGFLGYATGVHAPGKTVGAEAMRAVHHLLLGHGLAIQAMREGPSGTLGITLNLSSVRPASASPGDEEAARRMDGLANRLFLDPVLLGRYPDDVLENAGVAEWFGQMSDDLTDIAAPIVFMGVNYYTRHT